MCVCVRVCVCYSDGTSGGEALRLKADLTLRRTGEGKRRVCVCVCVCVCYSEGAKHADDAADRTRCLTR